MTVYLSGKITGTVDYIERFGAAQAVCEGEGYDVINPALVLSRMPKSTTYEQYMRLCYAMLEMADVIYLLRGWRSSNGAIHERAYAAILEKLIVDEEG